MLKPQQLFLVREPVDMRRGIDALTQHLEGLNLRWQDEAAFVFCNKARSRLKVLRWDRHGVWLCTRRLHADTDSRCWRPSFHACISRKLPGGPPQTTALYRRLYPVKISGWRWRWSLTFITREPLIFFLSPPRRQLCLFTLDVIPDGFHKSHKSR